MKKKNGSKESIEEFLKTERETKDNRLSKKYWSYVWYLKDIVFKKPRI